METDTGVGHQMGTAEAHRQAQVNPRSHVAATHATVNSTPPNQQLILSSLREPPIYSAHVKGVQEKRLARFREVCQQFPRTSISQ